MSSPVNKKPCIEPSILAVMMPIESADGLIPSLIESEPNSKLLFVDISVSGYMTKIVLGNRTFMPEDTLHGKINALRDFSNQETEDAILKQGIVAREKFKFIPSCKYAGVDSSSSCIRDQLEMAYRFDTTNSMHLGALIRHVLIKSAKAVNCDRVMLFVDPFFQGYRSLDCLIVLQCDYISRVIPSGIDNCASWLKEEMEMTGRNCVAMAEKKRECNQEAMLRVYTSITLYPYELT